MTSPNDENLNVLYAAIMPALARAAVGEFDTDLDIDRGNDPRVNEILMGVQVLLDVINEKIGELESNNSELTEERDRSVTLLDEVLRKSLD
jgi:hypothetical protein